MKVCGKCGNEKPVEEFNFKDKKTGRRNNFCKDCMKLYLKEHYKNNKEYYVSKAAKRNAEARKVYAEYKATLKCSVCSENHPACLEFHHIDPSTKEYTLSQVANQGYSKETIEAEMSKCIILCSNCHRKLHYEQKQSGIV